MIKTTPRYVWYALLIALFLALLAATAPLAQPADAASPTYYVATDGADGNPGTLERPYRTFSYALKQLRPGDTLFVRGGTYAERVDVKAKAATSAAPVRVASYAGERPVVQGLFWLKGADYWQISGINVTWSDANASTEHMVKLSGGSGWTFTNAEIWGARSYAGLIVTGGASDWVLSGLYIHDTYRANDTNQDHLLYVSDGVDGVIERSLFVNSENGRGVKLARPAAGDGKPANITVRYNTFVNNAGANVSTSYDAHDNQIYGNVMVGSGRYQNVTALDLVAGANTVVRDNVGWDSPKGSVVEAEANLVDGGNNRYLDPRLDGAFRPTDKALLDPSGTPLYGHLAGATGGEVVPQQVGGDAIYFPETGHSIQGVFRAFWEKSGGLPVFGYTLTDEFKEQNPDDGRTYVVQYLERQRFEQHPELAGTPYEVLLGRLGVGDARERDLLGTSAFTPLSSAPVGAGCRFFEETAHAVCGEFLTYWWNHGLEFGDAGVSYREALALFGYPISEPFVDPSSGLTVQYFERARFEYHPENAGTSFAVLLGRLSVE